MNSNRDWYLEKIQENRESADYYARILRQRNIPKARKKELQAREQYFRQQAEKHEQTVASMPANSGEKWPHDHSEKHRQAAMTYYQSRTSKH